MYMVLFSDFYSHQSISCEQSEYTDAEINHKNMTFKNHRCFSLIEHLEKTCAEIQEKMGYDREKDVVCCHIQAHKEHAHTICQNDLYDCFVQSVQDKIAEMRRGKNSRTQHNFCYSDIMIDSEHQVRDIPVIQFLPYGCQKNGKRVVDHDNRSWDGCNRSRVSDQFHQGGKQRQQNMPQPDLSERKQDPSAGDHFRTEDDYNNHQNLKNTGEEIKIRRLHRFVDQSQQRPRHCDAGADDDV